jgi:O-antigen/teichoic acid export membrane protein
LLKYMVSDEAAGIYNAAFLIMGAVYLFPSVIYQKFLLPKIHRWANHDSKRFVRVYSTGRWIMLLLGMAAMIAVWVLAPWGINILFGVAYEGAVAALRILALAIPLRFAATSIGSVLTTSKHMRIKVYLMAVVALANIVLNLMLIPGYGMFGAAISTVGCELLLLSLYHFFATKYVMSEHIA